MGEAEETAPSAAQAARALAATLLEQADTLDLHDLRATAAIEQVRVMSRALADAVYERGWGELYLGIDSMYPDEYDALEEFVDVESLDDELGEDLEGEPDDDLDD